MVVKKVPGKKLLKRKANSAAKKRTPAIKKKYTKTETLNELAQNTALSKKEVTAVLDELAIIIESHIKKRAVGEFTLPGLLKIERVPTKPRAARKKVISPFQPGKLMDIPRKPAGFRVKVKPLKRLKAFTL